VNTTNDIAEILTEMAEVVSDYALHKSKLDRAEGLLLAERYVGYSKKLDKKLTGLKLNATDRKHFSILREISASMTKFFVLESKGKTIAAHLVGVLVRTKVAEYRRRKNI
jgi:hypothetical protein